MCGTANVVAAETAASQQADKFVLISASPMNSAQLAQARKLPVLGGYVKGKELAEASAVRCFGVGSPAAGAAASGSSTVAVRATDTYAVIRPGFVYGNKGGLPLQVVGVPMSLVFSLLPLHRIPVIGPIFFEVS
jgi:hypothetical protein